MVTQSTTFRLSEEARKQLKELAEYYKRSQANHVEYLVKLDYENMQRQEQEKNK